MSLGRMFLAPSKLWPAVLRVVSNEKMQDRLASFVLEEVAGSDRTKGTRLRR